MAKKPKKVAGEGLSLLERLKKNCTIESGAVITESMYFDDKIFTDIPSHITMLNVAMSAHPKHGMRNGILELCGDSGSFKTGFALIQVQAFQQKYPDGICLFIDNEGGATVDFFKSQGVDMSRVFHVPVRNIEQMSHEIMVQCQHLTIDDHLMVFVDSIGNMASANETNNAVTSDESKADFTRAKALNSFFRSFTPITWQFPVYAVIINHSYAEIGAMYPKEIISGGKKASFSPNTILMCSPLKLDASEGEGTLFKLKVIKSRDVKKNVVFNFVCTYADGINPFSGLYAECFELGYLTANGAWIKRMNFETGEIESKTKSQVLEDKAWFDKLVNDERFIKHIQSKYSISHDQLNECDVFSEVTE